ncbi:hypothetical protein P691DRAFT_786393, partial [Macrolepiota fuliginosa MF-IS2]
MNQNHRAMSKFRMDEYVRIVPLSERSSVMEDLMQMKFQIILDDKHDPTLNVPPQQEATNSQIDKDDVHEIIDAFRIVGPWCEKFAPTIAHDDAYNELKRLIGLVASLFNLIPGPHQCPAPPPPPPCSRPHRDDEDIPMEPPAPTRAFSEAASQTPAPSHEASTPPPPPAAVATSPAAVASIPPA